MDSGTDFDLRIVSGGQTGADRAALDFAIRHRLPHGGWCPAGRRAEDGPIPAVYALEETPGGRYDQRTRRNVRDSDATLVVTILSDLTGGTALTARVAGSEGKPWIHVSRHSFPDAAEAGGLVRNFLQENAVRVLNVAGPRASHEPSIGAFVDAVLSAAIFGR